jgi:hypothetical protein
MLAIRIPTSQLACHFRDIGHMPSYVLTAEYGGPRQRSAPSVDVVFTRLPDT